MKTAHFSLHHKLALKLKVLPSTKSYIAFKCPFMQIEHENYLNPAMFKFVLKEKW